MFRYLRSIRFAINGLLYALRTERNVQIWFGVAVLTFLFSIWMEASQTELLIILLWMSLIGTAEYLNTSIEKLSDRVTLEYDEEIKRVKDIAAGATFVASIGAIISGLIIFVPKILEKFEIYL
ncbi:MAG: diacylglycerol kinase family protein [Flavobacteriaceae bacterium]|jgi:diacylglycerol kinase|nr:diacylglycerol kinase family protein [Flavobacteriaceae bacterium]